VVFYRVPNSEYGNMKSNRAESESQFCSENNEIGTGLGDKRRYNRLNMTECRERVLWVIG